VLLPILTATAVSGQLARYEIFVDNREDVSRELRRRCDLQLRDLPASLSDVIEQHEGSDRHQLTLRLVLPGFAFRSRLPIYPGCVNLRLIPACQRSLPERLDLHEIKRKRCSAGTFLMMS
jgi:hypothetical protein